MVLAKASEQVRAHDSLLCEGLIVMIYGMTPLCYFGMRGGVLILWGKVFNMCCGGGEYGYLCVGRGMARLKQGKDE